MLLKLTQGNAEPRPLGAGLEAKAEALVLSGLLWGSLWDKRSGTSGLDGVAALKSPGSLEGSETT